MKTPVLAPIFAALIFLAPLRSEAQQLNLQIKDGLVTLDAQNVSVRQILTEWARVGGTKVVNGEKVAGAPVTLQLSGVPERQALDTILRGVSGYMLASRNAGGLGTSTFDRILILPTSAPPRGGPAPNAVAGFQGPRPMPVQQAEPAEEIVEDTDSDEPPLEDEGGEEEVVQQEPPQGMNPRFRRGFPGQPPFNMPQQTFPGAPVNGPEGQQQMPPGAVASPSNPFGVPPGAGTTPGAVTPIPQQQDPNQPQSTRPRPPR